MKYIYRCPDCGEIELQNYGLSECPYCRSPIRRIYRLLAVQVKRGWTDVPYESRYENWSEAEKRVARERGG
jgi:DNA-directed RNA polymerase subunit RPC12/RpoP